jgi:hypothetical protein
MKITELINRLSTWRWNQQNKDLFKII